VLLYSTGALAKARASARLGECFEAAKTSKSAELRRSCKISAQDEDMLSRAHGQLLQPLVLHVMDRVSFDVEPGAPVRRKQLSPPARAR
jgi:hypothetical protein